MRLAKVDTEIAGLIKKAQQDKDVLAIIIFGSRARDDAGPTSDLDVCIVLQPKDYDDLKLSRKRL
ncbi:MAG TPA: nucleotidyltransferase domain-containing protein, partial [Candidatus Acetothermia bacterium]|nr:nucleotidyltransferase domain-containing protein [Candidatus Acetothermia bacterium]